MLSSYLSVVSCAFTFLAVSVSSSNNKATDISDKRQHRIQHGPCSYTFLLPEIENCQPPLDHHISNSLQRDSPVESDWSSKRLQQLEGILDNNTQWLQKVGISISIVTPVTWCRYSGLSCHKAHSQTRDNVNICCSGVKSFSKDVCLCRQIHFMWMEQSQMNAIKHCCRD